MSEQALGGRALLKGILLAGGSGTRLFPLTHHISKQSLPVYDKPLIYYPLATLMLAGIREICVVTTPRDSESTRSLLGDGSAWGLEIYYTVQEHPRGIAEAFPLARPHIGDGPICLVLGDNILHGAGLGLSLGDYQDPDGAVIFSYRVADPSSYGVVEVDAAGRPISLIEKPIQPRSNLAVPGLYFYSADVFDIAAQLKPSARNELEISDVNREYLSQSRLDVVALPRGTAWLDCGTVDDLFEASIYVQVLTRRQGTKIACPEEIAWRKGWISDGELASLALPLMNSGYGTYLQGLLHASQDSADRA
jgi:glucose-1-phosphate thymidylyltransferase